jgi:flagellar biosynthesis anti-sigma factor FlgM
MKLDPEHLPRVGREMMPAGRPSGGGRVKGGEPRESARAADKPTRDDVALTPEADRFRQLRLLVQGLPEIGQTERLTRLKALVAGGAYSVNGEKIAQAMLEDEPTASLLGLRPSR